MIIEKLRIIDASDTRSIWNHLKRFQNVSLVADAIERIHQVPSKHKKNIHKQAGQLRFCLIQAAEYFAAARTVSLATKPVLLYYGLMSLALAEILFKQDGGSSLDVARGENAHHGLTFHLGGRPPTVPSLQDSAALLTARPMAKANNQRVGTFDLWHRSSREAPLCAQRTQRFQQGSQTGPIVVAMGSDKRFPLLPDDGLTLLECLQSLPCMVPVLRESGIASRLVRAHIRLEVEPDGSAVQRIVVHPGYAPTISELKPLLEFHPSLVDYIELIEMSGSSFIVRISVPPKFGAIPVSYPKGFQSEVDEVFFSTRHSALNEFGFYYLGIYMLGNYARYHPESWMADVENSTQLSIVADTFISSLEQRVPLLTLSELSESWHLEI